jgi:hypothetical protein
MTIHKMRYTFQTLLNYYNNNKRIEGKLKGLTSYQSAMYWGAKVAVLLLLVTCYTTNLPTEHQVLVQKSYFEEGQQGTEVERWPTLLQNQTYSIIINELGETKHKDL